MKKILIVEDDKTLQEELKNLLNNANYNAVVLDDFLNAKDTILKNNPDLILLDINIPNIKVSSDNHIWNLVYIDNKWLHLDLTWDDTENTKYNNNYFLITKERLFMLDNKEHNFDSDFFLEAI